MKTKFVLAFIAAVQVVHGNGIVATRADLNTLLGASAVTENFETFIVADGNSFAFPSNAIVNSSTTANGQGPGLVKAGLTLAALSPTGFLQWNGANYVGTPSKDVTSDNAPLSLDFGAGVTGFGLDMQRFACGCPTTAMITIFAADKTTQLDVFAGYVLNSTPTFFGYQSTTDIGRVTLTSVGTTFYPIVDNVTFGAASGITPPPASTPEPASAGLFALGVLGLLVRRCRQRG